MTRLATSRISVMVCAAVLAAACNLEGGVGSMPSQTEVSETPAEASVVPTLRYVALGDSYTIGTSVGESDRWPNQLAGRLPTLNLVANLGVNGFTSRDVIEVELPRLEALRPEFITLLIGVNDVVQGVSPASYRGNLTRILDDLVAHVGSGHVLVVTTPDYTVTPTGANYGDPTIQSEGIREFNRILGEVAGGLGVSLVDVYDISLGAATDRGLVAGDGLHPSGAQYALWVARMGPAVEAILGGQDPVAPSS